MAGCGRFGFRSDPDLAAAQDAADAPRVLDAPPDAAPPHILVIGSPNFSFSMVQFDAWLSSFAASVVHVDDTTTSVDATLLAGIDVVFFEWIKQVHQPTEAAALDQWIASGGALFAMSGYDPVAADAAYSSSLLSSLGVRYAAPLINGPVTQLAVHPLNQGLSSIVFMGGYHVEVIGATNTVAVASIGADTVGLAVSEGGGRAYIWGDDWMSFDTSWQTPDGPLFWNDAMSWLLRRD